MSAAEDTIAAIATATGGGVGIVRLSGPRAEPIARAIVPSLPRAAPSHRLFLGHARDPESGEILDEVLAVVMRAPRSYTGEDVAELHGHGGAAVLQAILAATVRAGARLAGPGEFTRRALLGGKIDLSQAEAVAGIIAADDARSLRAAQALRRGVLGERVEAARRVIVGALAELEGALDFPDETSEDAGAADALRARLREVGGSLIAEANAYRASPTGKAILLVGRVNAGKSSLLNVLAGGERALVDAEAGTTRDPVEADVAIGEARLKLIDTAGRREDPTALEARGQKLADARRAEAVLALVVYDGSLGWNALDDELVTSLKADGVPVILVENKRDLPRRDGRADAVRISAKNGEGIDELRAAITRALALDGAPTLPIASVRQATALRDAGEAIGRAVAALPAVGEAAAVELRRALHHLGLVTGETADDEILDAIFARFCIGK